MSMDDEMTVIDPGLGRLPYRAFVLVLFLLAYLLNQLDRYILSIVTQPLAQELEYGDKGCLVNDSLSAAQVDGFLCTNITAENSCAATTAPSGVHPCYWDYNGQGFLYELLAGPVFIVVYTLVGIPLGYWADVYNRKILLGVSVFFWSLMTLLSGFVKEYWQLAILRFGLGIGEAGCTPFATSLITDYFSPTQRALAIGIYNWGIYIGYSMSYAVGNFITRENILGMGWRWTFIIGGLPGLLVGPLILLSVREPPRSLGGGQTDRRAPDAADMESLLGHREVSPTVCQKVAVVARTFGRPSVIMLLVAGSVRNAAGYVWSYNTQIYYRSLGETPEMIGRYMSWIPLVGGCLGVVLGGFISDRIVKRVGPYARLVVLIGSQILAAPFVAGALYLSPPYAYLILIPGYIIGEMWVGVTLAVLVEVIPAALRTIGVAVYLFVISNVGGNLPLLVPPLQRAFESLGINATDSLRDSLYILYPGMYVLASLLFLLAMVVLRIDLNRVRRMDYEEID